MEEKKQKPKCFRCGKLVRQNQKIEGTHVCDDCKNDLYHG